jgi:hypothetical protein
MRYRTTLWTAPPPASLDAELGNGLLVRKLTVKPC